MDGVQPVLGIRTSTQQRELKFSSAHPRAYRSGHEEVRPRRSGSEALQTEGVHPPDGLDGVDTGTATASVNPSVLAAEQAGSFSEPAPDQWRALLSIQPQPSSQLCPLPNGSHRRRPTISKCAARCLERRCIRCLDIPSLPRLSWLAASLI